MAEEHLDQHFLLFGPENQQKKIKVNPVIMGSNLLMLAELASQNCGIALLPDSIAKDFIKSGQLVKVLLNGQHHMVFSMQFIHHVEVYYPQFVSSLTIWSNNLRYARPKKT